MAVATERLNDIYKANMEAAQQFAMCTLEGAARAFKLQSETAAELYMASTRQLIEFWQGEASKPLANWPQLFEKQVERTVEVTRALVNSAAEYQNDMAEMMREQVPALNRNLIESVEQFKNLAVARAAETVSKRVAEPTEKAKKAA
ncbi:MAG: hypothetical protein ACOZCP_22150 [Pseudomonadota bacterium]